MKICTDWLWWYLWRCQRWWCRWVCSWRWALSMSMSIFFPRKDTRSGRWGEDCCGVGQGEGWKGGVQIWSSQLRWSWIFEPQMLWGRNLKVLDETVKPWWVWRLCGNAIAYLSIDAQGCASWKQSNAADCCGPVNILSKCQGIKHKKSCKK